MITTHVLDIATGKPAAGVRVTLSRVERGQPVTIGMGTTDADGRLTTLVPAGTALGSGEVTLTFDTGAYFAQRGEAAFHPRVAVAFSIADGQRYHVPLLISPFGYTTYRGS